LKVSELFYSIQGEGRLAGTASVFVRLAGCPLRCWWCDTPYALKAGDGISKSIDEIVAEVRGYDCKHVVVTGGEPLAAKDFPELMAALQEAGKHLTVETAAIKERGFVCNLVSMSPKLSHSTPWEGEFSRHAKSHEKNRLNVEAIQYYVDHYDYQLKFVVDSDRDVEEIEALLKQVRHVSREKVLLMPQAKTKAELQQVEAGVVGLCMEQGFGYSPRLHVALWDNQRGR